MDDVSESYVEKLRTLETRIELSEKRTRTLIEALPVGLFITRQSGQIEAANRQCLVLFACSYSDLKDRSLNDLFFLPSKEPLTITTLSSNNEPQTVEALRINGTRFPAEIIVRSFSTPSEEKVMIIIEDITIRHEVQRLKQEFVSMISHDLRTPLTSLQCFLSAISEGNYDSDVSGLKTQAGRSEHGLIAMITNLLNVDKITSGKLDLFLDVVAVSEIVESSVQSLSALAKQREIPINIKLPAAKTYVMADFDFMVQVLVNLLGNALKFSPSSKAVEIVVETIDSFVKITVSDSGPGIQKDFLNRIFNRFEQATAGDARVKGGSGLGLSISRTIVEQHSGAIGVDSVPGHGASFWFTLPKVDV